MVLLETWEHAVLVLSDGEHTAESMAPAISRGLRGLSLAEVAGCIERLETEGLLEIEKTLEETVEEPSPPLAGPRTLAGLQQAYREWHRDPVKTGQIFVGELPEPFPGDGLRPSPVGLGPTVSVEDARPSFRIGATFVVGQDGRAEEAPAVASLLDGPPEDAPTQDAPTRIGPPPAPEAASGPEETDEVGLAELLAAVDSELSSFDEEEATQVPAPPAPPDVKARGAGQRMSGEAAVPAGRADRPSSTNIETSPPTLAPTVVAPEPDEYTMLVAGRRRGSRAPTEAAAEGPARAAFGWLRKAGEAGASRPGGFTSVLSEASSTELAGIMGHLRRLIAARPEVSEVSALLAQVESAGRGEDVARDGGFFGAAHASARAGTCPSCVREGGPDFRVCPHCGYAPPA